VVPHRAQAVAPHRAQAVAPHRAQSAARHRAQSAVPKRALAFGAAAAVAAVGAVTVWQVGPAQSATATGSVRDASGTLSARMGLAARSAQAAESRAAERLIPAGLSTRGHKAAAKEATRAVSGRHGGHPAASATASPGPSPTPATSAVTSLSCSGESFWLPANYVTIVNFLVKHGYTPMGAVGIAGNIWQESRGDPESIGTGGGGLIGWTPLPSGYVTGNYSADLQNQLAQILIYNQQWSQYIPELNAATTPVQAADIYMDYFERPGLPAAINRETAAQAVAQACGVS
jgi:Phage tail lysozyme